MKRYAVAALFSLMLLLSDLQPPDAPVGIATPFARELPQPDPSRHVLALTHQYIACIDTEAHQAAWVAYRVQRSDWDTSNVLERNFHTPAALRDVLLEQGDLVGSGYDLGHCYGLQFVAACQHASEVNSMAAVIAQKAELNRGPVLEIENHIKQLSESAPVYVLNGQLWLQPMTDLPRANEPHKVASHLFILIRQHDRQEAWLLPQNEPVADMASYSIAPDKLRELIAETWLPVREL